jgi:hypothetical protein
MVGAAHAAVAATLQYFSHKDTAAWLDGSFKKVICEVTDEGFEQAKETEDHVVITESSLNDQEIAIGFRPREDWPDEFGDFPLYS